MVSTNNPPRSRGNAPGPIEGTAVTQGILERKNGRVKPDDLPEVDEETPVKAKPRGKPEEKVVSVERVTILPPEDAYFEITLRGTAPLITNSMESKHAEFMRGKRPKNEALPARDPKKSVEEALYKLGKGRFGFRAEAFKKALTAATGYVSGVTAKMIRETVQVIGDAGEFVTLLDAKGRPASWTMRTDFVRVGKFPNRVPDLRFRPEFKDWSVKLRICFIKGMIGVGQIAALFGWAGRCIGVGERRPSKEGGVPFGTFAVELASEDKKGA